MVIRILTHIYIQIILICIKFQDKSKVIAREAGGIETVIKTITTHINNASICSYGCGSLFRITKDGNNKYITPEDINISFSQEYSQLIALEAKGIEVVTKAINTHINNATVCFYGCGSLFNMVGDGNTSH